MNRMTLAPTELSQPAEPQQPAYDPNNLAPEDEEARKYDDTSDGIDWDEIIAASEDDYLAGRYAYNSEDYATQEEADAALREWLSGILRRVTERREREATSISSRDVTR